MKPLLSIICCLVFLIGNGYSQESYTLKVHFLYGSQPHQKYKDVEPTWFGGIKGGHVGLGLSDASILNFVPDGAFHLIKSKDDKNSRFALHDFESFYSIMGGNADDNKKTIIHIPITAAQKQTFDSVSAAYLTQTPYDYAFVGMRCASATYDVLSQLGIFRKHELPMMIKQVFYPKVLRKALLKKAKTNRWKIERHQGSERRKWEKD